MTARPDRVTLLHLFNAEVERLYAAYHVCGKSVGVFLHQSLALHADEATLTSVLGDVRDELARLSEVDG